TSFPLSTAGGGRASFSLRSRRCTRKDLCGQARCSRVQDCFDLDSGCFAGTDALASRLRFDASKPQTTPHNGGSMSHEIGVQRSGVRIAWYVVSALLVTIIPNAHVFAQGGGLEEIIVTAEFRKANVQDTPIAITAVNAEMLESRNQTNLAQITAQTPNVSLR